MKKLGGAPSISARAAAFTAAASPKAMPPPSPNSLEVLPNLLSAVSTYHHPAHAELAKPAEGQPRVHTATCTSARLSRRMPELSLILLYKNQVLPSCFDKLSMRVVAL